MAKDNRVTYRRRHSYNTASNKVKKVKTPGGKVVFHYVGKKPKAPSCGESGCTEKLKGLPIVRPFKLHSLSRTVKRINRAYGGSLCGKCSKNRIVRAFLIEEQRIVKRVLKESSKKKEQ